MPAHAHHAIQIVIALDGCIAIAGSDGEWREARGMVVRPDAQHSFDCNGAFGVMVFVDPDSSEAAWLSTSLWQDITVVPDIRMDAIVPALRTFAEQPDESADIAPLVRQCIHCLRPGPTSAARRMLAAHRARSSPAHPTGELVRGDQLPARERAHVGDSVMHARRGT
jgi:hypothetical protein